MNDKIPLIARTVPSSIRVTIPLDIVRERGYKPGDTVTVRISTEDPTAAKVDFVEFSAHVRKFGIQYMFTIPASVWPFVRDLGYDAKEVIPMEITRSSP